MRTFHARIFQAATETHVPIQPVGLCYGHGKQMDLSVPFAPKENFLQNFLRLLGGPPLDATVFFLEPVALSEEGRRQTAEAARQRIATALDLPAE